MGEIPGGSKYSFDLLAARIFCRFKPIPDDEEGSHGWATDPAAHHRNVDQELLLCNEYPATETRFLKVQIKRRLRFSDPERETLTQIGKRRPPTSRPPPAPPARRPGGPARAGRGRAGAGVEGGSRAERTYAKGFATLSPVCLKSLTLPVATVSPCSNAVAAIIPSRSGTGFPFFRSATTNFAHCRLTAASHGRQTMVFAVKPLFQPSAALPGGERQNPEAKFTQNNRIHHETALMGAQPLYDLLVGRRPQGLAEHIRIDEVRHPSFGIRTSAAVSIRSEDLNQPLTGQARRRFTRPLFRGAEASVDRYLP